MPKRVPIIVMVLSVVSALSTKKLIALDLDGTLLNAEHAVSKESTEKLRELCELGVSVCIASGRSGPAMYHIIEALALPADATYAVAYNGACGYRFKKDFTRSKKDNPEDKSIVFESCLDQIAVEESLAFAERNDLLAQVYIGDEIFVHCRDENHYDLAKRYNKLTGANHTHLIDGYRSINKAAVYKILLMTDDPDSVLLKLQEQEPNLQATLVRGSPPFFVEVLHHDVCKGNGLKLLCQHLDIPLDSVIAFGDGDNDVEFLQFSGMGIAMKNARPRTLAVADRITEFDNDNNGVFHGLSTLQKEEHLPSYPHEVSLSSLSSSSSSC